MHPGCAARPAILSLVFLASITKADVDPPAHQEDQKVQRFVTEPDIKAIPWSITEHDPQAIAPGYWFVAPLINNRQALPGDREFASYKTGAQIYDRNGGLVWSMKLEPMPHVQAFEPVFSHGEHRFSLVVQNQEWVFGLVMDHHFEEIARVSPKGRDVAQDFHELHLNPDGRTAILAAKFLDPNDISKTRISGFQEVNFSTGDVTFKWDVLSAGIGPDEKEQHCDSTADAFHLNSVDKNSEGEYLVSARHTSTVYKISGKDGSILWRLGGHRSDFTLDKGVEFHWQHDARFRYENATHTIISLLDNAACAFGEDVKGKSSGKIILLNHESCTASLLRHFPRPQDVASRKMGNLQTLGDDPTTSSVLINWATPGDMSEFNSENRLVLGASLAGGAVTSYRIFKSPFVGRPLLPPLLEVLTSLTGPNGSGTTSTLYMSWNGATEVRSWKIYILDGEHRPPQLMASLPKQGFETAWTLPAGERGFAFVEAIDASGKVLGKSNTTLIDGPHRWPSIIVQEQKNRDNARDWASSPSGLLWLVCAPALYGFCTAVHKVLVVYQRRRHGYNSLQYVRSGK